MTDESGAPVAVDTPQIAPQDDGIESVSTTHPAPEEPAPSEPVKAEDDSSEEATKKKGGFQRKLEKKDAEIAELNARLAKLESNQPEPKKPEVKERPEEKDFVNVLDYLKADAEWLANDKVETYKKNQDEIATRKAQEAQLETLAKAQDEREAEFIKTTPDYFDKIDAVIDQGLVTPELATTVMGFDNSPAIAYHLATYPADLLQVKNLKGNDLKYALSIISNHYKNNSDAAVRQTKAAPPIAPIRAQASTGSKIPGPEASQEEYEAWRYGNRAK